MTNSTHKSNIIKRIIMGITWVFVIICVLLCSYFTVFRFIDYEICIYKTARTLGVDPSYAAIRTYIIDTLKPGMSREQVNNELAKVGPIQITESLGSHLVQYARVDTVRIRMCSHPFNIITLYIRYTTGEKMHSIRIDDE